MAELKWSNVNGSDMTDALVAYQNADRTMFGRTTHLVNGLQNLLGDMQKGKESEYNRIKDENTQNILNQMANADSLSDLDSMAQLADGNILRDKFGSQINMNQINQAKSTWAKDVHDRAENRDNLQDFTPEQKELMGKIQQSLLVGDTTTATELLNSSNFSNKTKSNMLNSIYKARQDNIDFNLKIAENQGKLANTNQAIQAKQSELQAYRNEFIRLNGNIEGVDAMLAKDPTYQKMNQELQALGQSYNLILAQQKAFGNPAIGTMGSMPEFNINPQTSGSTNTTPTKQEVAKVQQAIQPKDISGNSGLGVAGIAMNTAQGVSGFDNKISQAESKKSHNDVTQDITKFDRDLRFSELLPPNAQKAFDDYVNGTFDYTKHNPDVLEQNMNKIIQEYNAKNGTNIPEVTIPKTNTALKDYQSRFPKATAELNKVKNEKLDELFGVTNNTGKGSQRNLLRTALDAKWKTDKKYSELTPNDVRQKLENGYDQGWYDGDDLLEKANELMALGMEAGEVMQLIDGMTNNGTKELEGASPNFKNNQWTQLENLVRDLGKNPELLTDLRDRQDKLIADANAAKTGLTNALGLGGSLTDVQRGGSGDKALQSRDGNARKVKVEQDLNKKINELSVLTDIAKDNKDTAESINELSPEIIEQLMEERSIPTADLVKLYKLSGNSVPAKLDEEVMDKIYSEVSKLSGKKIKELLQSRVDSDKLRSEISRLRKSMSEENVNDELTRKLDKLEAKLNR